jgi:hypothetical protein
MAGSCEHGNEPSDSIKGGEFLETASFSEELCPVELLNELLRAD